VRADEVNGYLKDRAGGDFSAKDFRTWNATVLAAVAVAGEDGRRLSKTARRRAMTEATKRVADYLCNTPAVCRSAYIDPRVFDRFDAGETISAAINGSNGTDPAGFADRARIERAVLALLRG
jgi:DNA topoisomerase IB